MNELMKTRDNVPVEFVNALVGRGVMNNVVNLTFGTFQFTPRQTDVDSDLVVSVRLRMDVPCAMALHAALGELLTSMEQEQAKAIGAIPAEEPKVESKPN